MLELSIRVPPKVRDKLGKMACARRQTLSAMVREELCLMAKLPLSPSPKRKKLGGLPLPVAKHRSAILSLR
jgi:hypothetical protein